MGFEVITVKQTKKNFNETLVCKKKTLYLYRFIDFFQYLSAEPILRRIFVYKQKILTFILKCENNKIKHEWILYCMLSNGNTLRRRIDTRSDLVE